MISSIYLCVNPEKDQGADVVDALSSDVTKAGLSLVDVPSEADAIISIGGDGTFLFASHQAVEYNVPVLGINLGRYGFLPSYGPDETAKAIAHLTDPNHPLSRTSLNLVKSQGVDTRVINEAVIERRRVDRAIRLEVALARDGDPFPETFTTFVCDGAIISTPLGSTAYASSVGGPVVAQGLKGMVLTFAALHHPRIPPLVCENSSRIVVIPQEDSILTCDGKCIMELDAGTIVEVTGSDRELTICEDQPSILERVVRSS
jgi:NAD+ kinase